MALGMLALSALFVLETSLLAATKFGKWRFCRVVVRTPSNVGHMYQIQWESFEDENFSRVSQTPRAMPCFSGFDYPFAHGSPTLQSSLSVVQTHHGLKREV
eukprot:4131397-Amphidinium_carterae.1